MTDPHGMAKLDPKGTVGTIYAGDHKTLLYTLMYSRTLVARTRLSRTPGIARTRSLVPAISLYIQC